MMYISCLSLRLWPPAYRDAYRGTLRVEGLGFRALGYTGLGFRADLEGQVDLVSSLGL